MPPQLREMQRGVGEDGSLRRFPAAGAARQRGIGNQRQLPPLPGGGIAGDLGVEQLQVPRMERDPERRLESEPIDQPLNESGDIELLRVDRLCNHMRSDRDRQLDRQLLQFPERLLPPFLELPDRLLEPHQQRSQVLRGRRRGRGRGSDRRGGRRRSGWRRSARSHRVQVPVRDADLDLPQRRRRGKGVPEHRSRRSRRELGSSTAEEG